jgi:hypothetical protein
MEEQLVRANRTNRQYIGVKAEQAPSALYTNQFAGRVNLTPAE